MEKIERIFYPKLIKSIDKNIVTLLTGIRQCGKTTAMKYLSGIVPGKQLWIDCDLFQNQTRLAENPQDLVADIEEAAGKTLKNLGNDRLFVFIDEVQKIPKMFDTIKWIYDNFGEQVKFFLSGSSSLNLYQRTSESLAGRTEIIKVFPFTLKEATTILSGGTQVESNWMNFFLQDSLREDEFSRWQEEGAPFKRRFQRSHEDLLLFGSLPGTFHLESTNDKWEYLANYRLTYIERDVRNILNVGNLPAFNKLLSVISNRTGNLLEYSGLATRLKINRKTVARYLNILQETYILFELQPFFNNFEKRLIKTPKIYFTDTGLRNQISGSFSLDMLEDRGEIGQVLEQFMVIEVIKSLQYSGHPYNAYFYRTHGGAEVDLVLETATGIILIEIKKGKKTSLRGIKSFLDGWKGKKKTAYILSLSEEPDIIDENIFRIAPWMLLV
jgi:predicted AAA+ superfamily ATPase